MRYTYYPLRDVFVFSSKDMALHNAAVHKAGKEAAEAAARAGKKP